MGQYLVLSKIKLQNANTIAGFTWGFPAITHFLGFTHALNREISNKYNGSYSTELTGCVVIANEVHNKVYKPKPLADFEFMQTKNPPTMGKDKASSPPIIEEGKLNATVSIIIELSETILPTSKEENFIEEIKYLLLKMRIAGGNILDIKSINLFSSGADTDYKQSMKIKHLCMPGFILKDRSDYLKQHTDELIREDSDEQPYLRAWLDFIALKSFATLEKEGDNDKKNKVSWHYQKKPFNGYLIPIMVGYKAIDKVYDAGQIQIVRDQSTPVCFVEPIHSTGEWISLHKVEKLDKYIWRYNQIDEWYLCTQDVSNNDQKTTLPEEYDLINDIF